MRWKRQRRDYDQSMVDAGVIAACALHISLRIYIYFAFVCSGKHMSSEICLAIYWLCWTCVLCAMCVRVLWEERDRMRLAYTINTAWRHNNKRAVTVRTRSRCDLNSTKKMCVWAIWLCNQCHHHHHQQQQKQQKHWCCRLQPEKKNVLNWVWLIFLFSWEKKKAAVAPQFPRLHINFQLKVSPEISSVRKCRDALFFTNIHNNRITLQSKESKTRCIIWLLNCLVVSASVSTYKQHTAKSTSLRCILQLCCVQCAQCSTDVFFRAFNFQWSYIWIHFSSCSKCIPHEVRFSFCTFVSIQLHFLMLWLLAVLIFLLFCAGAGRFDVPCRCWSVENKVCAVCCVSHRGWQSTTIGVPTRGRRVLLWQCQRAKKCLTPAYNVEITIKPKTAEKKTTCFSSSNMCITWNCNRISLIVQFPDYNVVVFIFGVVVVVVAMQSAVAAFIYLFFFFCFLLLLARQKCIAIFPVLISLEACNLVSCTLHKCIFQLCARASEENECIGKFN